MKTLQRNLVTLQHHQCSNKLVPLLSGDELYNRSVRWADVENCAPPCHSPFFTSSDRQFTELWISVWSILCCLSTSLTFSTFLMDPSRFHYPERPIMFLSLCYLMVSVGFLIRVTVGHEAVSCQLQRPAAPANYDNQLISRLFMPASGLGETGVLLRKVPIPSSSNADRSLARLTAP